MKLKNLVMILIIVFVLSASGTLFFYSNKVVEVKTIEYNFHISGHVGLVGDRDAIKFGGVSPGGWGERGINLSNYNDFPVKVRITIKGDKEEWVSAKENNFILEANSSKEVKIRVNVPPETPIGDEINQTGTVKAYFLKV